MKLSLISIPVQDPIEAHHIYTTKLGFVSKTFDAASELAIVVSPGEPAGTGMLLEPCQGTFAEMFQKSAYNSQLPIVVFSVSDIHAELQRLKSVGIKTRPELDRPDCGLLNMFEDGCGNLIMLEKAG